MQIVPGTEVNTPLAGAQLDAAPLRNAALAKGRVGAAIGDGVADFAFDVSQKIQANRNARTVFDADLAMRTQKEDFTAELQKMPDEGTWLPAWKERTTALKDQILSGPNVGPDVKRALSMKLDAWAAGTSAEIRTAALLKGAKETHDSAVAASTMAYSQGDMSGGDAILDAAGTHYAMDPSEIKTRKAQGTVTASTAAADMAIASDPINAPELVKQFKDKIPPRTYIGVLAHANEAKNRQQAANVNDLAMLMDESPDGTIDPELIKQKVKAKEITQRAADGLFSRMERKTTESAKSDFTMARSDVYNHDFAVDKNPEETAREFKDENAGLPTPFRLRLYREIDNKVAAAQKKGEAEQRPVEKEIFDQMREDRVSNGFTLPQTTEASSPGWFARTFEGAKPETTHNALDGGLAMLRDKEKLPDAEIKRLFGKDMTREKLIRAEQLHYATIQGKMRDWFADPENKTATYEQANAYRVELEKPFVMGAVSETLKRPSQYKSVKDVQAAYHSKALTRDQAAKILKEQFGLK